MGKFAGRNFVIVGTGSSVGRSLCVDLNAEGAEVYALGRTGHPELAAAGAIYLPYDPTNASSDASPSLPAAVHGLVYCPGTIRLAPFHRLRDTDFLEDFNINLVGAVRAIRLCLGPLGKAGGSSVVLFSTVAVRIGMGFHASIAAAKGAIEGLARSLAAEFAMKRIRVNAVAPSLTDTPLAGPLLDTGEKREKAASRHPLGRIGAPEDVARAALYLLSDDAGWVTGQVLAVDGGMSSVKLF
jgi:NAD(P)-dependent dehydrogenase (short-subunit alcohol dehydrogenase family)